MNERKYYYRGIKYYDGKVYKCARFWAEDREHRDFYIPYFKTHLENVFTPDVIVTDGFLGDRIHKVDGKFVEYKD